MSTASAPGRSREVEAALEVAPRALVEILAVVGASLGPVRLRSMRRQASLGSGGRDLLHELVEEAVMDRLWRGQGRSRLSREGVLAAGAVCTLAGIAEAQGWERLSIGEMLRSGWEMSLALAEVEAVTPGLGKMAAQLLAVAPGLSADALVELARDVLAESADAGDV